MFSVVYDTYQEKEYLMRLINNMVQARPVFTATLKGDDFEGKKLLQKELEHGRFKDFNEEFYFEKSKGGFRSPLGLWCNRTAGGISQLNPNTKRGLTGEVASFGGEGHKPNTPAELIVEYFEMWYNDNKPYNDLRKKLGLEIISKRKLRRY